MTRPCADHNTVGCTARVDCRLLLAGEERRERDAVVRALPPYDSDPFAHYVEHPPWEEAGSASVAVFLGACVLGALAFLAAIAVGQEAMCAAHDDSLRYCTTTDSAGPDEGAAVTRPLSGEASFGSAAKR